MVNGIVGFDLLRINSAIHQSGSLGVWSSHMNAVHGRYVSSFVTGPLPCTSFTLALAFFGDVLLYLVLKRHLSDGSVVLSTTYFLLLLKWLTT